MVEIKEKALNSLIAAFIIAEGCDDTTTGNWTFTFNGIESIFDLPIGYVKKHILDITKQCCLYGQLISISNFDDFEEIDIDLYTDYCGVHDEEGDQDEI